MLDNAQFKYKSRLKDSLKFGISETECGNRIRMELAVDRVQWHDLVLAELRRRIPLLGCQLFG
jgi:hypothetical protein